jgi:amino acid adenylation domain-containing protein
MSNVQSAVTDLNLLDGPSLEKLWAWNRQVPPAVDVCVHQLVERQACATPDASAIEAWDGKMEYLELERHANNLACYLVSLGVRRGTFVPICFDKSVWVVVAMLGIMKAGAAFVPIDFSQAPERRELVLEQVNAHIILTSAEHMMVSATGQGRQAIAVTPHIMHSLDLEYKGKRLTTTESDPSAIIYCLFTSGSTGIPKGVTLQHSAVSTSCMAHGKRVGFNATTRTLQFSSYTFDACIFDIFTTLLFGGCICIPSPDQRLDDVAGSIQALNVNTLFLTPTVARLVDPEEVPSLRAIVLGGEAPFPTDFERWQHLQVVMQGYGPTECAIFCSMNNEGRDATHVNCIGYASGTASWLVDPQDENKLAPIGSIGELVVEGPQLAAGYLNDEGRTAEAFINNPPWLLHGSSSTSGRPGRLYKTGDLVRYISDDGTMAFVGRKDAQVKLRGQRMELAETEHHTMACVPEALQVAALVAKLAGEGAVPVLIGFLVLKETGRLSGVLDLQSEDYASSRGTARFHSLPVSVEDDLAKRLPAYMIPTIWFIIEELPVASSGKVDRKRLGQIVSSFTVADLAASKHTGSDRKVSTKAERHMQQLWSRVLGVDDSAIGPDDSFFRLGGDSIAAMELVSQARKDGLALSVAQVFQQPKLGHLALQLDMSPKGPTKALPIEPFSMLTGGIDIESCKKEVAHICGVDILDIQDIYPTTALQAGLIALTSKQSGSYVLQTIMKLSATIDLQRFKDAWQETVRSLATLRTRIVQCDGVGLVQAVLADKPIAWQYADSLDRYLEQNKLVPMGLGESLVRFALIKDNNSIMFGWSIHHALYDGSSMPLIHDLVKQAYRDFSPPHQPDFNSFVKYTMDQNTEETEAFWKTTFQGVETQSFPTLPTPTHIVTADSTLQRGCSFSVASKNLDATMSMVIRAAWAMTIYRITGTEDVVFGATLSGRNAFVADIEKIVGPTIATVPICARVSSKFTVSEFLTKLQDHATAMIPYEQSGLQNIAKISDSASAACQFQTLLVVQPPTVGSLETELGTWQEMPQTREFTTYAVTLVCQLKTDGDVDIHCGFDSSVVSKSQMERMIDYLTHTIQLLAAGKPDQPLSSLLGPDPVDVQRLWSWNRSVPEPVIACVNTTISTQATENPDAHAISAHDGDFTFAHLETLSTKLAHRLVSLGITPKALVPLYFEKSAWTIVALLAVLKTGGAFVPLDPSQPRDRIASVMDQVNATFVLTSEALSRTDFGSDTTVVPVGPSLLQHSGDSVSGLPTADPSSAAYVIFTSGSTGVPKGVVIDHQAISSGCYYHGSKIELGNTSRVLQFASYTFDASIFEILTTLTFGGCVCVPSETQRSNDLAQTMESMGVNTALLTPSVARHVEPIQVPSLRTLLLGGEAATADEYSRWLATTRLFNLYGPTEASVICNAAEVTPDSVEPRNIGTATGSVSWIVDPNDPERLLPIGAIGELIVEGPILAQGYLGDSVKTSAAFIETPAWLAKGPGDLPGRNGRLYRTGDLAHYAEDGSMAYVGRRDAQVKIRGMRVELAEIEHHALACVPAQNLVVEVIKPAGEGSANMVALFVVPDQGNSALTCGGTLMENNGSTYLVQPLPPALESLMRERLPSHMVPALLFVLEHVDLNMAGKVDRKRLVQLGSSLTSTQLASLQASGALEKRGASTEFEITLQQIWAQTLNIEVTAIGMDDSFFRLGGDSITAMQVSSSARAQGLEITTMDIMQRKTITAIIQSLGSSATKTQSSQSSAVIKRAQKTISRGEPFPLSPIQQLFFLHQRDPTVLFDQCILLQPRDKIELSTLREALDVLVSTHTVLRTTFGMSSSGVWQQSIPPASSRPIGNGIKSRHVKLDNFDDIVAVISEDRRELDIINGSLMVATMINVAKSQYLFLSVHHLVVDLVSWRVILEDLENILSGDRKPSPSPMPFETWTFLQADYAKNHLQVDQALPFNLEPPMHSYWSYEETKSPAKTRMKAVTLDEETSAAILGGSNDAFATKPSDLMISALLFAFGQVFSDRPLPAIFNESHGREIWDSSIDLSRTVGWFTTLYPVQIRPSEPDILDFVRHVKDCARSIPQSGFPFFTSRFCDEAVAKDFASSFPVEIMFNYGGRYQQLERKDAFFRNVPLPEEIVTQASTYTRYALFDVLVNMTDSYLGVTFIYDDAIATSHEPKIQAWMNEYKTALEIVASSLSEEPRQWTLTDIPDVFDSYDSIVEFQEEIMPELEIDDVDEIEDIFPCAPTQEGILISQAKDPRNYRSRVHIKVSAEEGHHVDVTRLRQAWASVVQHHSLLRAKLIEGFPGSGQAMQIILKKPSIDFDMHKFSTADAAASDLMEGTDPEDWNLQHYLTIHRVTDQEFHLILEMNHAIVDGYSIGILLGDLRQAYQGTLPQIPAPSYREFVNYVQKQPYDDSYAFWKDFLSEAEPCQFPLLGDQMELSDKQLRRESTQIQVPNIDIAHIRSYCQVHEVTPATIIQTAWAMVLKHYTGCRAPSFGVLSSGRDLPIDGVETIFGPLIGMLVCHVDLSDETQTVVDLTKSVQDQYLMSLSHQNVSLANIQNALGLDGDVALFDTGISFQKPNGNAGVGDSDEVKFAVEGGVDPSEVC